ncbi:MAG: phosphate ABC transporter, permease protein PstA [Halothiobacillus sp. 24-54-40]|jgi:phosphate transport system permease protein|nr:phosphate ABC transporter permease PstA [Halothiobacillaceae bacterium]OYY43267.1 MAG: phosphate ABC transporter, permease protein PstA [Halothiobacillus sp. 35-54-62]OYZ88145.1 MAG: phosphate ABC transporter, permease protein PstA [Halothiobacillus sp. 24-54-40]OZA81633.1 MAG: phosphate ABC transporter, permease protein PstA [Halothiobacillus sp. 39-53-45]HQS02211.1 phosphate ABC transporter permease PstA [Halothiobacillus sp.]
MSKYQTRKLINYFNLVASLVVTALGLFMLAWILSVLFSKGFQYINWAVFTQMTPPPGSAGGLLNAIFGTLVITFFAVLIGTPIGIMAGTYLSEFGGNSRFSSTVRFINDVLLSAPSIVVGVFVYTLIVEPQGHFSGWAGAIALAILVIPVVVRTTEDMLKLVPVQLREAAAALGAPRYTVTLSIVYKAALSGMITGVLLATARIMGETAPLLFTALNNQFWSSNMNEPIANMPVVIYQYALSPYEDWQNLAWAAALLITLSVLTMNIIARYTLKGSSSR